MKMSFYYVPYTPYTLLPLLPVSNLFKKLLPERFADWDFGVADDGMQVVEGIELLEIDDVGAVDACKIWVDVFNLLVKGSKGREYRILVFGGNNGDIVAGSFDVKYFVGIEFDKLIGFYE